MDRNIDFFSVLMLRSTIRNYLLDDYHRLAEFTQININTQQKIDDARVEMEDLLRDESRRKKLIEYIKKNNIDPNIYAPRGFIIIEVFRNNKWVKNLVVESDSPYDACKLAPEKVARFGDKFGVRYVVLEKEELKLVLDQYRKIQEDTDDVQ